MTYNRSPICYYGGKQKMLKHIMPLLPPNIYHYCEPFFGGGSVFWAKYPSKIETVNDVSAELVNFYEVLKNNFAGLRALVDQSLHSEYQLRRAKDLSTTGTPVEKAWAFWMEVNHSFGNKVGGGLTFARTKNDASLSLSRRNNLTPEVAKRLEHTIIFCRDALDVISLTDSKDTFFYLDPPYWQADQGPYKGYTMDDFERLLSLLGGIEGRFLLSSYPCDLLSEKTSKHGWVFAEIDLPLTAKRGSTVERKVEVLTRNYRGPEQQEFFLGG